MPIRLHAVEDRADGGLRIIGDATDFDAPDIVQLWQGDSLVVSDTIFNPNYYERTPPTRPRCNHFIVDVDPLTVGAIKLGGAKLTVAQRGASQHLDVSTHLGRALHAVRIEPNPIAILSNPTGFDADVERAASQNLKSIYYAILSMVEAGILEHIPIERRVKWLDMAVFSLLSDGISSPLLKRLERMQRVIAALAPGSYAENSVRASYDLANGDVAQAMKTCEDASIRDCVDVSPWTSGMAGMMSIATLAKHCGALQLFDASFELIGAAPKNRPTFLVSADSSYFGRFGAIFLTLARNYVRDMQVHYNIINPTVDDIKTIRRMLSNSDDIVSFSVSYYDLDSMTSKNKDGFYTLNRFLILKKILLLCGSPVIATEADAKLTKDSERTVQEIGGSDVSYLAMQRYMRPWLHTTAPLLYVNFSDPARSFCDSLLSALIATIIRNGGRHLWGVDQAAIYCAVKFSELCSESLKTINLIPLANSIINQAQHHPQGKEGFVAENTKDL